VIILTHLKLSFGGEGRTVPKTPLKSRDNPKIAALAATDRHAKRQAIIMTYVLATRGFYLAIILSPFLSPPVLPPFLFGIPQCCEFLRSRSWRISRQGSRRAPATSVRVSDLRVVRQRELQPPRAPGVRHRAGAGKQVVEIVLGARRDHLEGQWQTDSGFAPVRQRRSAMLT
jgi:hypothetical protein